MHEFSIAKSIIDSLDSIAKNRGIERLKRIWLKVGLLKAVNCDALSFAFNAIKKSYPAIQQSELIVKEIPIGITCKRCGAKTEISKPIGICTQCGCTELDITSGNELFIDKIETC